jgi:hypothetical protein
MVEEVVREAIAPSTSGLEGIPRGHDMMILLLAHNPSAYTTCQAKQELRRRLIPDLQRFAIKRRRRQD